MENLNFTYRSMISNQRRIFGSRSDTLIVVLSVHKLKFHKMVHENSAIKTVYNEQKLHTF